MTIEQRKLLRQHPELEGLFVLVAAMYNAMSANPSFGKVLPKYLALAQKDFDVEMRNPDADI